MTYDEIDYVKAGLCLQSLLPNNFRWLSGREGLCWRSLRVFWVKWLARLGVSLYLRSRPWIRCNTETCNTKTLPLRIPNVIRYGLLLLSIWGFRVWWIVLWQLRLLLDKRLRWAAQDPTERSLSLTYALIKDDRLLLLLLDITLVAIVLLLY